MSTASTHAGPEVVRFAGKAEPPARHLGLGRLPDFLVVGAAKSGTTSLWFYLHRHPGVFFAEPKELEFFSYDDRYEKGADWYKAFFAEAADGQLCGEASTTYARWPRFGDVGARIAETVPGAKLVYIMRHPIERTYAQYRHRMRLPGPRMTFEEALESDEQFVLNSMYMTQLEQFLAHTPRERIHCMLSEDLKLSPGETLARLQEFLGLEPRDLVGDAAIESNRGSSGGDDYVRQRFRRTIKRVPGVRSLSRSLPTGLKDRVLRALTGSTMGAKLKAGYQPGPLTAGTAAALADRFREPNERLAKFLGRDLSHWSIPPESKGRE